ncbi:MAG: regulatory iron-sulfur-containing complex subunit RicT [bacterium]|nr:regulatory iron-sulfur-containing complex subunit RicT [bacterium]
MGCSSGGCGTGSNGIPAGCNSNGSCGTADGCNKLTVFDWLGNMNLPEGQKPVDIVEVRFKNSRKEFYRNTNNLTLHVGDAIAVEATSGHDMGMVSLTGELVRLQLKKRNVSFDSEEIKKVYRKAKQSDLDKWRDAQALETNTMYRARTIALKLGLEMKLSDVEFQGDKSKAVFYYTADARVDFRELIKVLADEFKVRIEMRQIGARQEASRLGGLGSCGRELCCSTWLTDFRTVNTSAARYQQLSLNPLKLAGQCGKLKCCLNYELDSYLDALKEFPDMDGKKLLTKKGEAFLQKTDIFTRMMFFSYRSDPGVFIPLHVEAVHKILEANAQGEFPDALIPTLPKLAKIITEEPNFENVVGQDSLTRFDRKGNKSRNNSGSKQRNRGATNEGQGQKPKQQNSNKGQGNPNRQKGQNQNRPEGQKQPKPQGEAGAKSQQNKPQNKPQNRPHNKPHDKFRDHQQKKPNTPPDDKNTPSEK